MAGFVFGLELLLIKKIDPLTGEGLPGPDAGKSTVAPSMAEESRAYLCDPETHVDSLAIEKTLTTHTLITLVLRCTF